MPRQISQIAVGSAALQPGQPLKTVSPVDLFICLDKTPVGAFLELEGKRHEITRFARSMGFTRADFIQADYVTLIAPAGETNGIMASDE